MDQVKPMQIESPGEGHPRPRRSSGPVHRTTMKRRFYRLSVILDHWFTQSLLALALVTTLLLPDLWVIGNPSNDADSILNAVLLFFFVVFSWEIVITCVFCQTLSVCTHRQPPPITRT